MLSSFLQDLRSFSAIKLLESFLAKNAILANKILGTTYEFPDLCSETSNLLNFAYNYEIFDQIIPAQKFLISFLDRISTRNCGKVREHY
jgi:hypothetical protein